MDYGKIKEILAQECDYTLSDRMMDLFLDSCDEVKLAPKEVLIEPGTRNSNVYILTEGILRYVYFVEDKEHTRAFACPGTQVMSMFAYYMERPAFMMVQACTEVVCAASTKENFDRLVRDYPEFAYWNLRMSYNQLYFYEMAFSVIKGNTKDKFISLAKNRPEILERVQLSWIASYLGVTPSYLSRMKRRLLKNF